MLLGFYCEDLQLFLVCRDAAVFLRVGVLVNSAWKLNAAFINPALP